MLPRAVLFAFCISFSLAGLAQTLDRAAGSALNNRDPRALNPTGHRFNLTDDGRVSITRLREPRKAQGLYYKAMFAWKKGRPAEAQRKLDEALKIYPSFPEALTLYGCIHAAFDRWDLAEQKLQAASESDPTYSPVYVVLAGVYNAQRRFDEAQREIQLGLSAGADTWHIQYEILRLLIGKGEYEGALVTADAALRSTPEGGMLHLAKAHALLGLRRYPQAVAELNTFLLYEPSGDGSEQARELLYKLQKTVPQ